MGDYLQEAYEMKQKADEEINILKEQIYTLCQIILKLDPCYDEWIKKNIGEEYVCNG